MSQTSVSIRVDEDVKKDAEALFGFKGHKMIVKLVRMTVCPCERSGRLVDFSVNLNLSPCNTSLNEFK